MNTPAAVIVTAPLAVVVARYVNPSPSGSEALTVPVSAPVAVFGALRGTPAITGGWLAT